MTIDWEIVNKNLFCPKCGEKAHITSGTDGTEGYHTHRFPISREYAQSLSDKFRKPTYEELEKENLKLRTIIVANNLPTEF